MTCKGKEHPVRSRVMFPRSAAACSLRVGTKRPAFTAFLSLFFAVPARLPSVDIIACQLYGVCRKGWHSAQLPRVF